MPIPKKQETTVHNRNQRSVQTTKLELETSRKPANGASPMYAERLKKLYAAGLKCRIMADEVRKWAPRLHSYQGFESIVAGAAVHLNPQDLVSPSPFEQFARLIQGASFDDCVAGLSADARSRHHQPPISKLQDPGEKSAAEQCMLAAGMALTSKILSKNLVTLCIVHADDSPGFWREAVLFAAARQLPIIFVTVSSEHATNRESIRGQAQQFLPAITVDGSDAVAVYRVAEESTRRARQGLGPSLIECQLHATEDPVLLMENYLKRRNLWSDSWKQDLERKYRREAVSAANKHSGKKLSRRNPSLAS